MSVEKKSSFGKAASAPLLSEGGSAAGSPHPASPPSAAEVGSSEINRISWGRAIGEANMGS